MLHLNSARRRPQPSALSEKEFQLQSEEWTRDARAVAEALPALDFVGWHGEHYVVVRHGGGGGGGHGGGGGGGGGGEGGGRVELKELPARRRLDCAKGVDFGGEDAAWMERKDLPMDYESPGLAQS